MAPPSGPFMSTQHPGGIQLSRVHSEAICSEIAEVLRAALTADSARLPAYLLDLTKRLDSVDFRITSETETNFR